MIWRGLSKRTSPTSLPDGASPDTVNADHAGGKIGLLGARKGKTAFNATGYSAVLKSLVPFRLPHVNQFLLGRTDGTIEVITGPYTEAQGTFGRAVRKQLSSNLSTTITEPDSTSTETVTWADGSSVGSNDLILVPAPTITMTGTVSGQVDFAVCYGSTSHVMYEFVNVAHSTFSLTPPADSWVAVTAQQRGGYNAGVRVIIDVSDWGGSTSTITVTGLDYALVYPNA